jgi:Ca2+-transporting ATPase
MQPLATAATRHQGLTSDEAARRLAADGPNLLPGNAPRSTAAIVRGVLTEPMFLMLLAAGGIYLVLGDRAEAGFLLAFVGVVIGITVLQERRTQRALEALRELSAPRAQVIRDGTTQRIAGRDVVRGDLLALREGDRIPADARLLEGALSVDESLLTGESAPVDKRANVDAPAEPVAAQDAARLFASTVVTRGVGVAVVEAVAVATAVGRIGEALRTTVEPPSALQQASRRLVQVVGAVALALAALLCLLSWAWDGRPLLESLLSGIALAMAILPEEIPLILTVFLALGARRDHGAGGRQDRDADAEPDGRRRTACRRRGLRGRPGARTARDLPPAGRVRDARDARRPVRPDRTRDPGVRPSLARRHGARARGSRPRARVSAVARDPGDDPCIRGRRSFAPPARDQGRA